MNILVTGADGQLGQCIKEVVNSKGNGFPNHTTNDKNYYIFANRSMLDITNENDVIDFIQKNYINVVINCAAYTNVEKAESDTENAYKINSDAVSYLAKACKTNGAVLIHVSTDYVFDGMSSVPYQSWAYCFPLSVYGKSKYKGETEIFNSDCNYLIFRVSSLYSKYGQNFVKSMINNIRNKDELNVIDSQVMSPTNAHDFARFLYHIIEDNSATTRYLSLSGIYHFCNTGCCSWYDLTNGIKLFMEEGKKAIINPVNDFPTIAKRPSYSVMDCHDTMNDFDFHIPYWLTSLKDTVNDIEREFYESKRID